MYKKKKKKTWCRPAQIDTKFGHLTKLKILERVQKDRHKKFVSKNIWRP